MLDWISDRLGGVSEGKEDTKRKLRELQFDPDIIPWAEAELTKILEPRQTGVDVADTVDELLRFRMNSVGQKQMRTLLYEKCALFEVVAIQKEAQQKVNKFLPRLFLQAQQMKEKKEEERKRRVKSKWSAAGMTAGLRITKQFVHEAALVQCRPTTAVRDTTAASSKEMGIRRLPMQTQTNPDQGENRSKSPVSCVTEIVNHARRHWQGEERANTAHLDNLLPVRAPQVLPVLKTRGIHTVKQNGPLSSTWPQNSELALDSTSSYLAKQNGTLPKLLARTPSPELEDLDPEEEACPVPFKELSLTDRAVFVKSQQAREAEIARAKKNVQKGKGGRFAAAAAAAVITRPYVSAAATVGPDASPRPATSSSSARPVTSSSSSSRPASSTVKLRPKMRSSHLLGPVDAWAAPRVPLTQAQGEALDALKLGTDKDHQVDLPLWRQMKKMDDKLRGGLVDQIFNEYAPSGKGMRRETLRNFLQDASGELYGQQTEVKDDHVQFILARCDKSNTNSIIKEELFDALKCWDIYLSQADEIQELWARYDVDNSGRLEEQEVNELLKDFSAHHKLPPPLPGEVRAAMEQADITETNNVVRMEIGGVVAAYLVAKQRSKSGNNFHPMVQFWCEQELRKLVGGLIDASFFKGFYDEICAMDPHRWRDFKAIEQKCVELVRKLDPPDREKREARIEEFVLELFDKQREFDPETWTPKDLSQLRQANQMPIIDEN